MEQIRDPDELLKSGLVVIDQALSMVSVDRIIPLFSGGYDSLCACYVTSQHPLFRGSVYHINTGIGSQANRDYVRSVCKDERWCLKVYRSKSTYEAFVRKLGFPGSGSHQWVYNVIKDRCVSEMTANYGCLSLKRKRFMLVSGCRGQESRRRMAHLEPIKIGEKSKRTGKITRLERIWVSPCHDWSSAEQIRFVNEAGFLRNPIKDSPIGMSGECFCGAFARPYERELISQYCPDVDKEISRLEVIAKQCGTPCIWGQAPNRKLLEVVETGPLCSSCDAKARDAGIIVKEV